jgi:Kelch motif/Galactose oxidase, central domain
MKRSLEGSRKIGAHSPDYLRVRQTILFFVIVLLSTASTIVRPAIASTKSPGGKGWIQIHGPGPSPRWTHAMVLDRKRQQAVVFGGFGGGREVWIFSFAARTWNRVDAANGPTPRASPAAVADFARDRMVVVGGLHGSQLFDEVWAFSFATQTWSQVPKGPSPRFDMGAVTDGIHAWFYGGFLPKLRATDELWQLDLATDTWTKLPQSKVRPSPRTNMGIGLYQGSMYVIGGHDAKGLTPGTWRYDFSTHNWTELSPAGKPGAGAHFASATDKTCARLFLAGGDHDDNIDVDTTDEFLFLNPAFIRLATTRNFPARRHSALVLEPHTRTLMLFGGIHDPKHLLGDTWFYQLGKSCTP